MRKVTQYFAASYQELQKVVWPSRKVAIRLTIAVIVGALLIGTYLTLLGLGFSEILQNLLFKN